MWPQRFCRSSAKFSARVQIYSEGEKKMWANMHRNIKLQSYRVTECNLKVLMKKNPQKIN